ncbi:MAG: Dam family site-specific DNA-(adenine-N6)-methyltransferase [Treponema sp.]|nr:Dam family site-specific DNA-(adenine-N6)-methyltransferase [Treponema sp.]
MAARLSLKRKPFLKWAGGKNQLLEQFEQYFPGELKNGKIDRYAEPFLGGGAVYFSIIKKYKIKSAYLSDINKDLILTYSVVQQKSEYLLDLLEQFQQQYDAAKQEKRKALFLSVREQFNKQVYEIDYGRISENWISRAAQFIFLNKTCFNGLYRLNSKEEFNVPCGRYKTAAIFDADNITSVSDALQNAEISLSEYRDCYDYVNNNTLVYFDPPYRPISRTSKFTSYTGDVFSDARQIELAEFYQKLDREKGAKLMLSNSDPANIDPNDDFFAKIYKGYNINKVYASRAINCQAGKRGKISEILVTNY